MSKLVYKGFIPEQYSEWTRWVIDKTVHNYTKDINHEYYKKKAKEDEKVKSSFFEKVTSSNDDKDSDEAPEPDLDDSDHSIEQSDNDDPLMNSD